MIRVLHVCISEAPPEAIIQTFLHKLPETVQQKYDAYLKQEDKLRFLAGRLLLLEALLSVNEQVDWEELGKLEKNRFGKPYFPHLPGFYFNISHAGDWVVCAFSIEMETGIDIEQVRPVDLNDFREFIPLDQWESIRNDTTYVTFYRYWTLLESVLKADGKGLSTPVHTLRFSENAIAIGNKTFRFERLAIAEGYVCTLVVNGDCTTIDCYTVPFDKLLQVEGIS